MTLVTSSTIPAAGSLAASMLAAAVLVRVSPRRRKADRPPLDARERSRIGIPRVGGTAIFAGAGVGVCLLNALTTSAGFLPPLGIVAGAVLIFSIGLTDDFVSLAPRWKLCGQTAAAMLAWSGGFQVHSISLAAGTAFSLGILAFPATVLWLVTVANAVNLIDGLDGLAGGFAAVVLAITGIIGGLAANNGVVVSAVIGLAALTGFLRYNARSARLHLGDSGSLFIGFALGILSVEAGRRPGGTVLVLVPVLLLAVPLTDIIMTVFRRIRLRVPISRGDSLHVHHRLLGLGLTEARAVLVLLALAAITGGTAVIAALTRLTVARAVIAWMANAALLGAGLAALDYPGPASASDDVTIRAAA